MTPNQFDPETLRPLLHKEFRVCSSITQMMVEASIEAIMASIAITKRTLEGLTSLGLDVFEEWEVTYLPGSTSQEKLEFARRRAEDLLAADLQSLALLKGAIPHFEDLPTPNAPDFPSFDRIFVPELDEDINAWGNAFAEPPEEIPERFLKPREVDFQGDKYPEVELRPEYEVVPAKVARKKHQGPPGQEQHSMLQYLYQ